MDRLSVELADGAIWTLRRGRPPVEAGAAGLHREGSAELARPSLETGGLPAAIRLQGPHGPAEPVLVPLLPAGRLRPALQLLALARELEKTAEVVCLLGRLPAAREVSLLAWQIALLISLHAIARGGVLLHGALVYRDGCGVILAGPNGAGKTTASRRLPRPWVPLSDDASLVVRGPGGRYWAHPWPGPTAILCRRREQKTDVRQAVPLRGIFRLEKDERQRVQPVGGARAVGFLLESAAQSLAILEDGRPGDDLRWFRRRIFHNTCSLAAAVPVHQLWLNLTSCFCRTMEHTLGCGPTGKG